MERQDYSEMPETKEYLHPDGRMTNTSAERFLAAYARGTEGLEAFSVGACPGCRSCGLDADSFTLKGATTGGGSPYRLWDEGSGPLWIYCETLGPAGVIRADTFEEAWECAVDEIMDDADPEDPDTYARSYDDTAEDGELAEGVHYRGSGVPSNPSLKSPLSQEDLNGATLVRVDIDARDLPSEIEVHGSRIMLEWSPDPEDARQVADEGSFSWSDCDTCGSSLGGDRYPAHYWYKRAASAALPAAESIEHLDVCADCLMFAANGDAPEEWWPSSAARRDAEEEERS